VREIHEIEASLLSLSKLNCCSFL